MKWEVFGEGRVSLKFGNQKINLHQHGKEFELKATQPTLGSADLCFLKETPLEEAMTHVSENGIQILEGPIKRSGATTAIVSFYLKDPDGNLIEIANPQESA